MSGPIRLWPGGRWPEGGVSSAGPGAPALPSLRSLQGLVLSLSWPLCPGSQGRVLPWRSEAGPQTKQGGFPELLTAAQPGEGGDEAFPGLCLLGNGWWGSPDRPHSPSQASEQQGQMWTPTAHCLVQAVELSMCSEPQVFRGRPPECSVWGLTRGGPMAPRGTVPPQKYRVKAQGWLKRGHNGNPAACVSCTPHKILTPQWT